MLIGLLLGIGFVRLRLLDPVPPFEFVSELQDDRLVLAYVFQPGDCESALRHTPFWNNLHAEGPVRVVGLMLDAPTGEAAVAELVRRAGIRFPVRVARDRPIRRALQRLGIRATPVSALVAPGGRPLLILERAATAAHAHRQADLVRAYADALPMSPPTGANSSHSRATTGAPR